MKQKILKFIYGDGLNNYIVGEEPCIQHVWYIPEQFLYMLIYTNGLDDFWKYTK